MSDKRIDTTQIQSLYSHSMGAFDDAGLDHDPELIALFEAKGPNERAMMNVWASAIWAWFKVSQEPMAVPNIVVGGNHQWGDKDHVKEPLGQLMAEATLKMLAEYNIPGVVTLLKSWTDEDGKERPIMDTSSEVISHIQHSMKKGYSTIGSVSSTTHLPSIEQNYQIHTSDSGLQVATLAAEPIIKSAPEPFKAYQYGATVSRVNNSEDERSFKNRELLKRIVLTVFGGIGEKMIREKTQKDLIPGEYATPENEEFPTPTV